MTLHEEPNVLSEQATRTTAGTTELVEEVAKQWHWRPTITGTAAGTHTSTTLEDSGLSFDANDQYVSYRITKTAAADGVVQQSIVTSTGIGAGEFTFDPAMDDDPVDGDTYSIEPPVGYRPLITAYTVSWGDDWGTDGTIIISSVNEVGTTTLETFQTAAGVAGSESQNVVQLHGPVHGNIQFTTSHNGHCSVQVNYRWVKLGAQLQHG